MSNGKKLLALCSVAVVCVASYAAVESAHRPGTAAAVPATVSAARTVPPVQTTRHNTSVKKSSAHPVVKQTKATTVKKAKKPVVKQKYKDGTYTGVGQTQIGAVQVAVTVKKDKITSAQITGYSTHYPISYIDPVLPQELLQRQNINQIDVVSGATLSTEDFYYAVVSCLQQAQKANAVTSHA